MSDSAPSDSLIWHVRYFIYQQLAQTGRAPSPAYTAQVLGLTLAETQTAYQQLHQRHAILLQAGTNEVRMANPFSAIATDFIVEVGKARAWANCAWDALGIPAAVQADAKINAHCAQSGAPIHLEVRQGQFLGYSTVIAHFAVPFANWYDDLIHT